MAYWRNIGVEEVSIGGFQGLHEAVAPINRPLGLVSRVSNLRVSRPSALSTRQGLTRLGTAQSGIVRGIHRYTNLSGSTVHLIAGFGSSLMRYNPATQTWTSIGSLSDNRWTAANIASSSDYAVFFDGVQPKKWNGTTLTNLSNAPKGRYVVEAYNQLFVGGIPGRENDVAFCDVALPEVWSPSPTNDAGSITVGTDPIRWIGYDKVQGKVLIWTTRSVEQLNGPETPNRPNLWSVRTVAQEGTVCGWTVQHIAGNWIWLADDAFCVWAGGSLTKIVEPFRVSFNMIDWSKIDQATSWVTQQGEYVCSVPQTGGGVLWFVLNPQSGWLVGTGPDIRAFGMFEFDGRTQTVLGDADGKVYMAGGATDDGAPVTWYVEIGPSILGNAFERKHLLSVDVVVTLAVGGTAYAALSVTELGEDWGPTYSITPQYQYNVLRVPVPPARSDIFRLKIWGTGQATVHDVRLRFATGRS
ncbi:hypothetical protein [Symbiobacterium thermophilum]|uniref:Uncharacterized protein n=1 Tax=Symbiobacterium thermophilum TaxID=2734 RepID=A0A953IC73_SYMTR|nr:hypothetical protein [Symbiobacterium thermophilum]MBY6275500.1 hypothetical protein [Symbiobacterium thermophilum]